MDIQTVLSQVELWSVEDSLRLIDQIWDSLLVPGSEPELTPERMRELSNRVAEDEASPDDVVSWEVVKTEAYKRAGR